MKYRSWFIVPGNDAAQLDTAFSTGADVVVVDLENTVPHGSKGHARALGAEWLATYRTNVLEHRDMGRWVRINALDSGHSREDLAAVMAGAPDGIILPNATGPDAVRQLASEIYELEQHYAIPASTTRILPVVGDTPRAAMRIGDYLDSGHQRLHGLTWSATGLALSIGASGVREENGCWSDACGFVRAQALLTAHASQIIVIDAAFEDFEDGQGTARAARRSRADGFAGMFAIHPGQIGVINAAFTPSEEELEEARAIIAAFASSPHAGSLPFGGRMVDRSHLAMAQRLAGLADMEAAAAEARRKPILRPA
ncbi:HpcH/HpaI aldolase/citrate lyase family protein [Novosphingobium mangrovi (ex Huang et al. 2023)]|uniref:CoA ester lyase n=1 Tax=Novosphingobium mangrovi (ex Huang et al. 2023) TaxID=2976432 RepID=A0ABT2HZK3_9SPHN|nr:CoA ester lyase [Novosphingobium mangrovi (ex Huang et al. 2023)]MCT2397983.1 CoA ester lyase [Novosphingobium mangrovi (ex Huang et al. 2023)]